jgi:UDP-glucose 4-epimerase
MKTLVTGGAGFLGRHVVRELIRAGHEVTVFDLGKPDDFEFDCHFVTGDLADYPGLQELVSDIDVIYHFAGLSDIDECARRPLDAVRNNIMATTHLLEAARVASVKRFIFASSAYVFSNAGYVYRTSKRACEDLIHDYSELFGLPYTILRYGSLYGEGADSRNSIYELLRQAIVDKRIVYHGDGDEVREFIHVQDAAESSVKILAEEYENTHLILTGVEKMTYLELLTMVKELMNNEIEIVIEPSHRKAHYKITPYNYNPKISRKLTNNPHIDIGQGLLSCISELVNKLNES